MRNENIRMMLKFLHEESNKREKVKEEAEKKKKEDKDKVRKEKIEEQERKKEEEDNEEELGKGVQEEGTSSPIVETKFERVAKKTQEKTEKVKSGLLKIKVMAQGVKALEKEN